MEGITIPEFKTPAPISPTRARERRKSLLLKKLGLNGKNYNLEVLETLKRKNKNKETEGGWKETIINGEYYLEVYNPPHVDIFLDMEEYIRLNEIEFAQDVAISSLPTIPETEKEEEEEDKCSIDFLGGECEYENCDCH